MCARPSSSTLRSLRSKKKEKKKKKSGECVVGGEKGRGDKRVDGEIEKGPSGSFALRPSIHWGGFFCLFALLLLAWVGGTVTKLGSARTWPSCLPMPSAPKTRPVQRQNPCFSTAFPCRMAKSQRLSTALQIFRSWKWPAPTSAGCGASATGPSRFRWMAIASPSLNQAFSLDGDW